MTITLGLDFETSGLDPTDGAHIIEVGAQLRDVNGAILGELSRLVRPPHFTGLPDNITELTAITTEMINLHSRPINDVSLELMHLAEKADYWVAHHAEFEQKFLYQLLPQVVINELKWIDTLKDIDYENNTNCHKLSHLCLDHGIMTTTKIHRTLTDVNMMMDLMFQYNIEVVIENAETPDFIIVLDCHYDDKDLAKEIGYRFNPDLKKWYKEVRQTKLIEEQDNVIGQIEYAKHKFCVDYINEKVSTQLQLSPQSGKR